MNCARESRLAAPTEGAGAGGQRAAANNEFVGTENLTEKEVEEIRAECVEDAKTVPVRDVA